MQPSREIELKLEIVPTAAARLGEHPLVQGRGVDVRQLTSMYFDTGENALWNAGCTVRIRQANGRYVQTVKAENGRSAGIFDRPEWEQEVDGPEPKLMLLEGTPVKDVVAKKKVQRELRPVFEVQVERQTWHLPYEGAEIEMTLDLGHVIAASRSMPIAEVELELKAGAPASLFSLAAAIGRDFDLRIGVQTKSERGYALIADKAGRIVKAEAVGLSDHMTVAEGFAAIAHACLRHYRLNETIILEQGDPAALHQARVAIRRLRSAFSLFKPVLLDTQFQMLRDEFRSLAAQLGEARDLDVFLADRLGRAPDEAGEAGRSELRERLESERTQVYQRVVERLSSRSHRMLLLEFIGWVEIGRWRVGSQVAEQALAAFAEERLDMLWKKLKKRGRNLAALEPEARHQVRIDSKKMRYATEFFEGLFAGKKQRKAYGRFVKALAELQQSLGELNDLETAHSLLNELMPADSASAPDQERTARAAANIVLGGDKDHRSELIAAAEAAHARLEDIGPFWR